MANITTLTTNDGHFFGARGQQSAGDGYGLGKISSNLVSDFGGNRVNCGSYSNGTLVVNKNGDTVTITLNGTSQTYNNTPSTFSVNYNLFLFCMNDGGTASGTKITSKIHNLKIYELDSLLYSFVPVPAGFVAGSVYCPTAGMFDIVEQKFYPNKGTGTFTYGRDTALSYNNLGFTATCVGGYNVFIDGEHYGTYASASQCNIIWSQSGVNGGDDITIPSALKAHKIWIEPAAEGNNITAFHCDRVSASGNESQGLLWTHFNLTNVIRISNLFGAENIYKNTLLKALTAKNNLITYDTSSTYAGLYQAFPYCSSLEYLPVLKANSQNFCNVYLAFYQASPKKVVIKNNSGQEGFAMLNQTQIEELNIENGLRLYSNLLQFNDAHGAT